MKFLRGNSYNLHSLRRLSSGGKVKLAIWKRGDTRKKQLTLLCYVNTAGGNKLRGICYPGRFRPIIASLAAEGPGGAPIDCAFPRLPAGRRAGKEGTQGCGFSGPPSKGQSELLPGRTGCTGARKATKSRRGPCRPVAPFRGRRARGAIRFARRGVHASLHFWPPAVNICVHSPDSAPLTN